ncbi:MAG: hypothetical protein IKX00_00695 [Bacilli bacterium]|nr:hypothetical protein [Bacilli bacterium]
MSKFETSIACIECGNKLFEKLFPMFLEYKNNFSSLSYFEKETYNTILGSQYALICEYYLKGLFISNMEVIIPDELKSKINALTEEQELMIILSDENKIRQDELLSKLDKKELRVLLNNNSLKSFGHSLVALLGTETLGDNKRIIIPNHIRKRIIWEMYDRLYNPENETDEEKRKFQEYIHTPISKKLVNGDILRIGNQILEEFLSLSSTNDAFPKGRYGIFNNFISNVDFLSGLAFSIRHQFKYQYTNLIELYVSKNDKFGKFIYPDKDSKIIFKSKNNQQIVYDMVPIILYAMFGMEITWNAAKPTLTPDEMEYLKTLKKYDDNARITTNKIYLDELEDVNTVEYTQNCKTKQIVLKEGRLYEVSPTLSNIKTDSFNVSLHYK